MMPRMRPPFPVRLTDQTFTCAAKAHVVTAERRTACTHVSRARQPARRRPVFVFTSRLGRRAEAGPRQVLRRVRRPTARTGVEATYREPFQLRSVPAISTDQEDVL